MDDFTDDELPPRVEVKQAAKMSENDQDKLLASGDEKEEYTDIFESPKHNGFGISMLPKIDFEEGESVSASDDEITGYTGDMENYTESEVDSKSLVAEGTLINLQQDDTNDNDDSEDKAHERKLSDTKSGIITKSVTNESISEIADKLVKTEIESIPKTTINTKVVPGSAVKITVDSTNSGYSSSEEVSKGKDSISDARRKKFRKHTSSFTEQVEEVLTSSGEYNQSFQNQEEQKHRPRKKTTKIKEPASEKLIEIETPPQTPHHETTLAEEASQPKPSKSKLPTKTIPIPGFKPLNKKPQETDPPKTVNNTTGSQKKRKRTRHKVYLDDPDVHQLITDHVLLLKKYLEDVAAGRTPKRDLQSVGAPLTQAAYKKVHHEQRIVKMPIAGAVHNQNKHNIYDSNNSHYQQHQQQHHNTSFNSNVLHHNQHPGPYSSHHTQPQHYPAPGGHAPRGKNIVARIQQHTNDDMLSSSTDEEDNYGGGKLGGFGSGYQKVNTSGTPTHQHSHHHRQPVQENHSHHHHHHHNTPHNKAMPQQQHAICQECGDYHHHQGEGGADVREVDDVCPDCGVQHSNPYEHMPGAYQDPNDEVRQVSLPSVEGPHSESELNAGVRYKMKYLGSCQITTQHPVTKETRMQQAQDAYKRIKNQDDDEDDDDVSTNVDMFISLERIKILNKDTRFEDVMMDHALRTVCFICDMGKILVLMARRLTSDGTTDFSIEQGKPITLGNIMGEREKKTSKNICHVFEGEIEASEIAKAIGQAFNMAYRQFLTTNGISHDHVEEAEYGHVLESQKLVGIDLDRLTDNSQAREVVVNKRRGDPLGIMLLESGWGSMLPTVFIAHLQNYSAAARSQRLTVGDHILAVNGASLVGLPLSECNETLRNTRTSERVIFRVVSCPPVVDVVVSRPDVKYQLGFSVQNGTICSLLRGGIAERGGVRVGHRIIEINGDSVVAKKHQHIVDILANTIGSISMKTMPVAMYRLMVGEDQPLHV